MHIEQKLIENKETILITHEAKFWPPEINE